MKAIIFSHLFERGKEIFKNSSIQFIICHKREEERFLKLQKQHQAAAIVIDSRPLSIDFFKKLLPQTLIVRFGVGLNNIPMALCRQLNHPIVTTPKASTSSVSEYIIAQMILLSRQLLKSHNDFKAGEWNRIIGNEIQGKTLAILGMGNTGRDLAKKAKLGFGMKIIGMVKPKKKKLNSLSKIAYVDQVVSNLKMAVQQADFISINLSLNSENEKIINKNTLHFFKKDSILINIARGKLIDEEALYPHLKNKKIAGAALDVFTQEPYQPSIKKYDLRKLDNVILTPHIASNTREANQETAKMIVNHIADYYKKLN